MPAGPGGLGQQWREAHHPPADRDVAFDQELFDVTVGQAEAQLPAHRQHDHVGWEAEAGKGGLREGSRARAAGSHAGQSRCWNAVTANATVPLGPPGGVGGTSRQLNGLRPDR
jgi:hypothetical protein